MYDRALGAQLEAARLDTPVVFLTGPRQSGKSTLARAVAQTLPGEPLRLGVSVGDTASWGIYRTLDDANALAAASADPQGFLAEGERGRLLVIDEVQRVPELLVAIKRAVDEDRRPGRYLLTGSANIMSLPQVSESLAGRMELLHMWPLAQCEIEGAVPTFLSRIFTSDVPQGTNAYSREDLLARARRGGYPEALVRSDAGRRDAWFGSYVTAVVQREIRSISAIGDETAMLRVLRALATRTGGPRNLQNLAGDTGIASTTLARYVALLRAIFLIAEIPAWHRSLDARLVKAPKLLVTDSGLYAHLLGGASQDPYLGLLFETFVGAELLRLIGFEPANRYALFHFRTHKQHEVDFVIEDARRRIVGVEVKLARNVTSSDFNGLRTLALTAGDDFYRGVVLYAGERTLSFGEGMWAVPASALWS